MTGLTYTYWLEQTEADVPAGNQWLSVGERSRLAGMRFDKRRRDWRLGRWTAKRLAASCLNLPTDVQSLGDIEIRAAPSGAPELFLFNQNTAVSLSLSHRAGKALCVLGLSGERLGCDLELIESRDDSFVTVFFTPNERRLIDAAFADQRPLLATLLWSAKESVLKALRVGLRWDTTLLDVSSSDVPRPDDSPQNAHVRWFPLVVRCTDGPILRGRWRCANGMVRTVVFNPMPVQPYQPHHQGFSRAGNELDPEDLKPIGATWCSHDERDSGHIEM